MSMTETVETLEERLTRLEEAFAEMTLHLSALAEAAGVADQKNRTQVSDPQGAFHNTDKPGEAAAIQKMREHFGIADIELIPLEELRQSLADHGIRAEDNEFSRAIIAAREK